VRLRETPEKLKVKLFSIASSDRRIDALCTNYIDDTMTAKDIQEVYALRWKVEEFNQQMQEKKKSKEPCSLFHTSLHLFNQRSLQS
jgi:hypothetical protein